MIYRCAFSTLKFSTRLSFGWKQAILKPFVKQSVKTSIQVLQLFGVIFGMLYICGIEITSLDRRMKNRLLILCLAFCLVFPLHNSYAQVGDLPRSTPEEQGIPSASLTLLLDSLMAIPRTDIHSVMVLRHGHVVAEMWPAPFAPEYRHTMYSCSKTFVSAAVGLAIEDNRLRLDDRVGAFFPDQLPDTVSSELAAMTVRDLLTMTSGITPDWQMRNHCTDWIRTWLAKPLVTPGTKFQYDSLCTYLLAAIVQKATGMTLLEYLKLKLFNPMHITEVAWEESPEGFNTGGWGLHIQTESLAKFGQLLLDRGVWDGEQLLPASWVEEMMKEQVKGSGYGYQMWMGELPGSARADGALGQYILVYPDKDVVVVITECTLTDGRAQRRQVVDLLLSKTSEQELEVGRDYKRLQRIQTTASLPLASGKAVSPLDKDYTECTITLPKNKYGWQSLGLYFDRSNKEVAVNLTDKDGTSGKLLFGYRRWEKASVNLFPPYSISPIDSFKGIDGPFWVAGSYGWTATDELNLKAHYVNWISALDITIRFLGDKAEVTVSENFSSGKPLRLEGTIE